MGVKRWKTATVALALCLSLLVGCLSPLRVSAAQSENYLENFSSILTGDQSEDIVRVAETQLGYIEGENLDVAKRYKTIDYSYMGWTKFGRWYGSAECYVYGAWCAMFVSWCSNRAGISTSIVPKYCACLKGRSTLISRGTYHERTSGYTPKRGDIVFFSSAAGRVTHTGIVVDCVGDIIYTIEGNTSNMVAYRQYRPGDKYILGYASPKYKDTSVIRDLTPPVISNAKITDVSGKGYRVTADVSDALSGVRNVYIENWTTQDGKNESYGMRCEVIDGKLDCFVSVKEHTYEKGEYNTVIYALDNKTNCSKVVLPKVNVGDFEAPKLEKLEISEVSANGLTISAKASDPGTGISSAVIEYTCDGASLTVPLNGIEHGVSSSIAIPMPSVVTETDIEPVTDESPSDITSESESPSDLPDESESPSDLPEEQEVISDLPVLSPSEMPSTGSSVRTLTGCLIITDNSGNTASYPLPDVVLSDGASSVISNISYSSPSLSGATLRFDCGSADSACAFVWTSGDSSKVRYPASIVNGTAKVQINPAQHNGFAGTYHACVYAFAGAEQIDAQYAGSILLDSAKFAEKRAYAFYCTIRDRNGLTLTAGKNGAAAAMKTYTLSPEQIWYVRVSSDGFCTIRNFYTDTFLTYSDSGAVSSAFSGSGAQDFVLTDRDGFSTISPRTKDGVYLSSKSSRLKPSGYGTNSKLTVKSVKVVTSVSHKKSSITLKKGKTFKNSTNVKLSSTAAINKKITYSSSNSSVASVSSSGTVKGKKGGVAYITATAGGFSSKMRVFVSEPTSYVRIKYNGVSISSIRIRRGTSVSLTAARYPSSSNSSYTWYSSNSKIAKISSSGILTGVKTGTTRIRLKTSNGRYRYLTVKVTA